MAGTQEEGRVQRSLEFDEIFEGLPSRLREREASRSREKEAAEWFERQVRRALAQGAFAIVGELYPELSTLLLAHNELNRKSLSRTTIEKIRRDMVEGRWHLNGETIIIALEGQMNDGQHRCLANQQAGVTVETLFFFGAERISRFSVDSQSTPRAPAHFLEMGNYANSKSLAHAARLVHLFDKYAKIPRDWSFQPTKGEIVAIVEKYRYKPDLTRKPPESAIGLDLSVAFAGHRTVGMATPGILAACHFLFSRVDLEEADVFLGDLFDGANLTAEDPALVLRQRLYRDKAHKRRDEAITVELIVRAWNMRRRNFATKKLQVGDKFPAIE